MIRNKVIWIAVIVAVLEFMLLQIIIDELPESKEIIWGAAKNLIFVLFTIAIFVGMVIAISGLSIYTWRRINDYRRCRKYKKTQKQILDDPVHWPGHRKGK